LIIYLVNLSSTLTLLTPLLTPLLLSLLLGLEVVSSFYSGASDYTLLPLTSRTPNIYSIGKSFIANSSDSSNPSLEGVTFHDSSSGVDYSATEVPSLSIRVHKVNIRQAQNQK
jgi:hypothetical protein